jgi:hypothetical protein
MELADYDRECRRAVALLRLRGRIVHLPRPIPLRDGHLTVVDAAAGSVDLVIEAVGVVALVLTSNPVQLLLTADAILGKVRSVRAWMRQRSDPLAGVSARNALAVLREFGSIEDAPGIGQADHVIRAKSKARHESYATDDLVLPEAGVDFQLTKDRRARGHRITHIRARPDGTIDILLIE